MQLSQYLVETSTSQSKFAETLGVSQATVHKWLYGKNRPSADTMVKIKQITEGQVAIEDWFESVSDG